MAHDLLGHVKCATPRQYLSTFSLCPTLFSIFWPDRIFISVSVYNLRIRYPCGPASRPPPWWSLPGTNCACLKHVEVICGWRNASSTLSTSATSSSSGSSRLWNADYLLVIWSSMMAGCRSSFQQGALSGILWSSGACWSHRRKFWPLPIPSILYETTHDPASASYVASSSS